ncbi:DNA polymerase family X repair subunit beta [uncultured virus]|nr:DNA polymerase family X repair subunit beta [uncultured virus]
MDDLTQTDLSPNRDISFMLAKIAGYYGLSNDKYRRTTYEKAAKNVRDYNQQLFSGKDARDNIAGIGESIQKDIDQYLTTGQIERLNELIKRHGEEFNTTIDLFLQVHGIGPVKAIELYKEGYRSLSDLRNAIGTSKAITAAIKIGLKWFDDLQLRIPRTEMDVIIKTINELFQEDPNLQIMDWEVAGSYRRGEKSSGDLDLLVSSDTIQMHELVRTLQPIIVDILAQGSKKLMAVIKLDDNLARRLDIRLFSTYYYPYALLHSTGSKDFNVLMRNRAIELGYKLSEYSLCNKETCLPASSESDIFKHLGVQEVAPTERTDIKRLTIL